jgi:hypothetical protein
LVVRRRSRAEVGEYPLVCFERGVKADRQSRTRKQPCVVKVNWMIESACYAGHLIESFLRSFRMVDLI